MQAEKDRIQQIQTTLTGMGIQPSDYVQLYQLLHELKQLQNNIAAERGQQFFEDAFTVVAGMGLSRDMVAIVAQRMRSFAEKIVATQAAQNATPASNIPDVVDNVTPNNPTA